MIERFTLRKKTETWITGWGGIILGFLGLVGLPTLSVFVTGFSRSISIPLWAFLSIFFTVVAVSLLIFRNLRKEVITESLKIDASNVEHEKELDVFRETELNMIIHGNTLTQQLQECRIELQARDELIFESGAYYRITDSNREQPFCRHCYDFDKKLITVSEFKQWNNNEEVLFYYCPKCKDSHVAQIVIDKGKNLDVRIDKKDKDDEFVSDNIPF